MIAEPEGYSGNWCTSGEDITTEIATHALCFELVFAEQVTSRNAPSGRSVDDADLESVPVETKVLFDTTDQSLHRRVTTDRPPPPALPMRTREPRLPTVLVCFP